MGTQMFGLEITELRLGLPGGDDGGDGGDERRVKKRVFHGGGREVANMVVGWPPVCLHRTKSTLDVVTKLYVKVSMDGAPILRKIDLSCFKGYFELGMGLEKLFDCYGIGEAMKEDNGSCEYIAIYEDRDGDWMLVGDVPWLKIRIGQIRFKLSMRAHRHPPLKTDTVASMPEENGVKTARTTIAHMNVGGGVRKKATGIRQWLLLDSTGQGQLVEAGKHTVMRRTGLPARDLRILDPILSYPSTVLGRERAIVINLEHIKAIITAHEVLLLNSKDPSVTPFVEELQRRIMRRYCSIACQERITNSDDTDWSNMYVLGEQKSKGVSSPSVSTTSQDRSDQEAKIDGTPSLNSQDGLKLLRFEFVALETCIEAACTSLDKEARTLEKEAHPALDKLTSKISTLNLERVRQIKSRLVTISGRVQKVRDELEHLLDDDEDMAEMYLTEKLERQRLENTSVSSVNEQDRLDEQVLQPDMDENLVRVPLEGDENIDEVDFQRMDSQQERFFGPNAVGRDSRMTRLTSIARNGGVKHRDVEELEMLLEAYFVQIDGTMNKLSTLREYVEDTEDYINIMLDDKQNHLLQMGVMLSTASLIVNAFVVVVGAFGMNINIDLFKGDTPAEKETGMHKFRWTVGGCTTGSIFLYIIAIAWYKNQRLLE